MECWEEREELWTCLTILCFVLQSQVDSLGMAAAKEAAIGAIRDPVTLFIQQRGMLTLPAIQALDSQSGE